MKWETIDSAPKDGSALLLWEQYSKNPFVGYWNGQSWSCCHEHVEADGGWNGAIVVDNIQLPVTHWAELPKKPEKA